jgi:hypothetical protein
MQEMMQKGGGLSVRLQIALLEKTQPRDMFPTDLHQSTTLHCRVKSKSFHPPIRTNRLACTWHGEGYIATHGEH